MVQAERVWVSRGDGGRLNLCSTLAHPSADLIAPFRRSGVHVAFQVFTLSLVAAVGTAVV